MWRGESKEKGNQVINQPGAKSLHPLVSNFVDLSYPPGESIRETEREVIAKEL
jgi:hypothetical protein